MYKAIQDAFVPVGPLAQRIDLGLVGQMSLERLRVFNKAREVQRRISRKESFSEDALQEIKLLVRLAVSSVQRAALRCVDSLVEFALCSRSSFTDHTDVRSAFQTFLISDTASERVRYN